MYTDTFYIIYKQHLCLLLYIIAFTQTFTTGKINMGTTSKYTHEKKGKTWSEPSTSMTRWWFQIFFIFIPTWGNHPIWRAYFCSTGLEKNHQLDEDMFESRSSSVNKILPQERGLRLAMFESLEKGMRKVRPPFGGGSVVSRNGCHIEQQAETPKSVGF